MNALSVISMIIALGAMLASVYQNILSNKQKLFEKRVEVILLIKDLMSLYAEHWTVLKMKDIYGSVKIALVFMTNCSRLESMSNIIEATSNTDNKKIFLLNAKTLKVLL